MAREDYEIVNQKPVGRGAFGTVFQARRLADGAAVAFKLVLHSGEGGAERIDAERKGAILQQRFAQAHGKVPEVYDFGPDGDDFYIAMEFIEGGSLETLLRQGPLAPADAAGHALWLSGFLENAHAFASVVEGKPYRVVHTDLKPAHLMIAPSGERKVLDFGIAKALEESRELGTDIGRTIAYASPERLVSDQVGPDADFWSLGVMLFEMICGHRPYPHLDGPRFRRDLEHAITANTPRAPLPVSCPAGLRAIVNKLLAFQVENRYRNAQAIKADLELFLAGATPAAVVAYETPATTPVKRPVDAATPATPRPLTSMVPQPVPATTPRFASREIALTEPRPMEAASGVKVLDTVAAPAPPAVGAAPRPAARRLLGTVPLLVIALVASEGVASMFAGRFYDGIATIDERNVTERRRAYDGVDGWALLDIGLRRSHSRLRPQLLLVGDRVIADYRREEPTMGPAEWGQAREALAWAAELSRRDDVLRGKQLTAEGHVRRLAAQAGRGGASMAHSETAMRKFRDAADADPSSFDPYLGMARIQAYALADVDGAAASIAEAEKRGYTSGRREAALLGDGYLRRATTTRRAASKLSGEQRWRELKNARADYERCVVFFDPIVAFANAAENLETCKTQIQLIDRQLDRAGEGT